MAQASQILKDNVEWSLTPIKTDSEKDTYSSDDVIDAYLQGRQDQKDADTLTLMEKLESNLNNAKDLSVEILQYITESQFKCTNLHLKIKDIHHMTTLFVVNEDDYLNDRFLDVYKKSIQIKKRVNTSKTFDFSVIFTTDSPTLDVQNIVADGFILSYVAK